MARKMKMEVTHFRRTDRTGKMWHLFLRWVSLLKPSLHSWNSLSKFDKHLRMMMMVLIAYSDGFKDLHDYFRVVLEDSLANYTVWRCSRLSMPTWRRRCSTAERWSKETPGIARSGSATCSVFRQISSWQHQASGITRRGTEDSGTSAWDYLRVGVSIQEYQVLTNVTNTICLQETLWWLRPYHLAEVPHDQY